MTQSEWDSLCEEVGPAAAFKLCESLDAWAKNAKAKYRKRVDHYETLRNWHRKNIRDGFEFFEHPIHGPDYYKSFVIRQFNQEQSRRAS